MLAKCLCLIVATLLGVAAADDTAQAFQRLRGDPVRLAMFLRAMPKGGDLHNHIDGAVYAENFLSWAAQDGLCVDTRELAIVAAPCHAARGIIPAATAAADDLLYRRMVDALSMKDFVPGIESGHDHFFATFAKFNPAAMHRAASMLAEVADRAGAEHISYLELMWSPGMFDAAAMADKIAWNGDATAIRAQLEPELSPLVAQTSKFFDTAEQGMRQLLSCGTPAARPGCGVTIRYQAQVIRILPPADVFGEILFGYMLSHHDPRVVAVNLVAAEDTPVALRDYDMHMHMLRQIEGWYPGVKLSLHAGELVMGLVPPEDLRFHIRDAVEIAHANRIGHGVDIMDEDNAPELLAEMARRKVMVEINLTSNDLILGVHGADHPFMTYRAFGVPVALSTDDEGVSRIDLTHEFVRAVETYPISYDDLKQMARNSLEYAFLAGPSLWQSADPYRIEPACAGADFASNPSGACLDLVSHSDKAKLQWKLEGQLRSFEAVKW